MKQYARLAVDGTVLGLFDLPDDENPDCGDDIVVENPTPFPPGWPPGPSSTSELKFISGAMAWVEMATLDDLKAAKNVEIVKARVAADFDSFEFGGKHIAVDEASFRQIQATNGEVALTQQLPINWPGGWKAIDNTYVAIPTVGSWITFYQAMVQAGLTNFNKSQVLKAAVAAATTPAQVTAIVW
jgi:hypothetical protein